MSRRNHIKRAKILRGRLRHPLGSYMSYRSGRTGRWGKFARRTRENRQRAQAMRGCYHD